MVQESLGLYNYFSPSFSKFVHENTAIYFSYNRNLKLIPMYQLYSIQYCLHNCHVSHPNLIKTSKFVYTTIQSRVYCSASKISKIVNAVSLPIYLLLKINSRLGKSALEKLRVSSSNPIFLDQSCLIFSFIKLKYY